MTFGASFYRLIGRRFSTLFLAVTGGMLVFDYGFNSVSNAIWDFVSFFLNILIF